MRWCAVVTSGMAGSAALVVALIAPVLGMPGPVSAEGPFLVIVSPFSGGVETVVARAGGQLAAPVTGYLGAVASGAAAEAFFAAGALMVFAPPDPSYFCAEPSEE